MRISFIVGVAVYALGACSNGDGADDRLQDVNASGSGGIASTDDAGSTGGSHPTRHDAGPSTGGTPAAGGARGVTDCTGATRLTEEQWEACKAPRTGEHAVESRDCERTPIAQEYQVTPTVECRMAPDYDFMTNRRRDCAIRPYCTTHEECTAAARGRCVGVAYAFCEYPNADGGRACASDAECQAVPGGHCASSGSVPEEHCYPTGECEWPPERTCAYQQVPCETDGDCTAAPGGICRKTIAFSACEYHECFEDGDCSGSERCACQQCVPSTCSGDHDCASGQTCRLGVGCHGFLSGYDCSTSADECATEADCGGAPCEFDGTRFRCRTEGCPTIP